MAELELHEIKHKYSDKEVLNNINFKIENGVVALLGPNGAGKTTLIKIITGLLSPTSGKVIFNNKDIAEWGNCYYDYLGYMPQMPNYYNNFTGEKFLRYMAVLKGLPKRNVKGTIDHLLELVNLNGDGRRKVGTYSGGIKQRLGIAVALLNDPQILILDEPTAGLDPNERIRFRNIISKIANSRIVILATHIVSDVECIAKSMLLLKNGEIELCEHSMELMDEMKGNVWCLTLDQIEDVNEMMENYLVSNIKELEDGKYSVRILCNEKVSEGAYIVEPSLEDLFLYYFNDKEWK